MATDAFGLSGISASWRMELYNIAFLSHYFFHTNYPLVQLTWENDRSVSSIAPFEEGQKETELERDDFSSYLKNIAKNLKSPTKKY